MNSSVVLIYRLQTKSERDHNLYDNYVEMMIEIYFLIDFEDAWFN